LHEKIYQAGISGIMAPVEYGGQRTPDVDPFFELIMCDELARLAGGGVLGQLAINSMALPPILSVGSTYLKDKGKPCRLKSSHTRCGYWEEEHLFSYLGALCRL
jgi:alkylation response protein AidB-like acyl-CoA dehydrogenase